MGLGLSGSSCGCDKCTSQRVVVEVPDLKNAFKDALQNVMHDNAHNPIPPSKNQRKEWDKRDKERSQKLPNPNPKNCQIDREEGIGRLSILCVKYPDCTNYDGYKIMVFDLPLAELKEKIQKTGFLDPHFCPHSDLKMIARFIPDFSGWEIAKAFCKFLQK